MKHIIIGGDAAGMTAAMQIKRLEPKANLVVFEKGMDTSYGACGIPYFLGGEVESIEKLVVVSPEDFREKRGLDVRTQAEVISIDPQAKKITVQTEKGKEDHFYDRLLIATGSSPIMPAWPKSGLKNIFGLRNLADARRLAGALSGSIKRIGIVGAGYVGLETAEAFAKKGFDVTVIEKNAMPLSGTDKTIGQKIVDELKSHNVRLLLGATVSAFDGNERVKKIITDQGDIDVDLAIVSLGVKPNSDLAKNAGIELGPAGSIKVDEAMKTSAPNIYAAGDCAQSIHGVTGQAVYIPLALPANRMGRVAGANMTGASEKMPPVIGSAVTRVFDLTIAFTGLTSSQAKRMNRNHACFGKEVGSTAHYMKSARKVFAQIIIDPETGKMLGAEMAGRDNTVGSRINTVATAISSGMNIWDFANLDLAYAPPFNPVWDPWLQVVNRATLEIKPDL